MDPRSRHARGTHMDDFEKQPPTEGERSVSDGLRQALSRQEEVTEEMKAIERMAVELSSHDRSEDWHWRVPLEEVVEEVTTMVEMFWQYESNNEQEDREEWQECLSEAKFLIGVFARRVKGLERLVGCLKTRLREAGLSQTGQPLSEEELEEPLDWASPPLVEVGVQADESLVRMATIGVQVCAPLVVANMVGVQTAPSLPQELVGEEPRVGSFTEVRVMAAGMRVGAPPPGEEGDAGGCSRRRHGVG